MVLLATHGLNFMLNVKISSFKLLTRLCNISNQIAFSIHMFLYKILPPVHCQFCRIWDNFIIQHYLRSTKLYTTFLYNYFFITKTFSAGD